MTKLTYTDHEGATQEIEGCTLTVDALDRHWIWCEQLDHNIVYKTKGRENALLAAIDSLLFAVRLSARLSVCPSLKLSVCLSVHQIVCLPVLRFVFYVL